MIAPTKPGIVIVALLFCASAGSAGGAGATLPRLTGIVVGPQSREAVFADRATGRRAVILREGAAIGPYKIKSIAPRFVVVEGPRGIETLALERGAGDAGPPASSDSAAASPAHMLAATTREGLSIGGLAIGRDRCARDGLLQATPTDAESKLAGVIGAMADLPARQGVEAVSNAPTKTLAEALRAGLDAARRQGPGGRLDRAACLRLDARWRQSAGRFGLL